MATTALTSPPVHPCLWFERQAEEAAHYYLSVFPSSSIDQITRYRAGAHMPEGTVLTINFTLNGQRFTALNGGPAFSFNPAVSFVITCQTQEEIDHYWTHLSAHPESEQCGWLKDRFGVSWQIVPQFMMDVLVSGSPAQTQGAMQAMMRMKKLIIADLEAAFRAAS